MKQIYFLILCLMLSTFGFAQTECLNDDFSSGYGNWTGSGTYTNTNAGNTGNGAGFNSTNDALITSEIVTNPNEITFSARKSGSSSNYSIEIQYSTDGTNWITAEAIEATNLTLDHTTYTTNLNLTGDYYIRYVMVSRAGGSFYLDDVVVTCGTSVPTCNIEFGTATYSCSTNDEGADNDFLTISIPYTGSSLDVTSLTVTIDGSADTATGDNPSTVENGTIKVEAYEGALVEVTLNGGLCDTATTTITVPSTECDPNTTPTESTGGQLTFQMINPCGVDGDNEFVVFTSGSAPITIDDIALGSVSDETDTDWNYFWSTSATGGSGPTATENGNSVVTSSQNAYGITDPIIESDKYDAAIAELNGIAGNVFYSPDQTTGEIPAGASVVFFLGYDDGDGFDDAATNLDFTEQALNAPFYIVLGKGTQAGGFFSNSNPRTQYMTIGGTQTNVSYTPTKNKTGGGKYLNPDGEFVEDDNCIPQVISLTETSNVLPVELIHFEADQINQTVELSWSTVSENNNNYFTIEYSTDGINWQTIGQVNGAGTTTDQNYYNYTHRNVTSMVSYYRLKQVDFDERFVYSNVIIVNQAVEEFSIAAMTKRGVTIHSHTEGNGKVTIYTINGQLVYENELLIMQGITKLSINLVNGIYIVHIAKGEDIVTGKFIIE